MEYKRFKDINFDRLQRVDLGSQLNFSSAIPIVKGLVSKTLAFEGKESSLSPNEQSRLATFGENLWNLISGITNFKVDPGERVDSAIKSRNDLIEELKKTEDEFNAKFLPILVYSQSKEGESELNRLKEEAKTLEAQLRDKIENISLTTTNQTNQFNTLLEGFRGDLENSLNQARENVAHSQKVIKEAENFSTGALVDRYGNIFEKQAIAHKKLAIISLLVFSFFTGLTIWLAFIFFKPILDELKNIVDSNIRFEYVITNIVFRLTLLFVVMLFVKESLKNFNVNMHLYNLNTHRNNSLLSFNAFISNTQDDQTRNHLIKEISRTIYSVNQIGYLTDSRKGLDVNQVIELLKAIKE